MLEIIWSLIGIVTVSMWIAPFIYVTKLAGYIRKNKPRIYKSINPGKYQQMSIVYLNSIYFWRYLVSRHPDDDEKTQYYKKRCLYSLLIGILLFFILGIYKIYEGQF